MTVGVLECDGVRYCIVPEKLPELRGGEDGFYFDGGPSRTNPRSDSEGRPINPLGHVVPKTQYVHERDLWLADGSGNDPLLHTIGTWPVYPYAESVFRYPRVLIEQLIANTQVEWDPNRPDASVYLDWGGQKLSRRFRVAPLDVGVAVWPPRIVTGWTHFYFLFAPGTTLLAEQDVSVFSQIVPMVHGFEDPADAVTSSELRELFDGKGVMCRSAVTPRWISFRSRSNPGVTHGFIPIAVSADGTISLARTKETARTAFRRPPATPPASTVARPHYFIAVDFGTSNTAVAIGSGENDVDLLRFTDACRAANVTAPSLDPYAGGEFRFRFFPIEPVFQNPMPTLMFEAHDGALPFSNSALLPNRMIPAERLAPNIAANFIRSGSLQQDFKWKNTGSGPQHASAFLEMLALIVAWQLRASGNVPVDADLQLVFTRPLAFDTLQTESLRRIMTAFETTFRACGFGRASLYKEGLLSESLANYHWVEAKSPKGNASEQDRHVVIDIGGGTTDISIFAGGGDALYLDSLQIGGKDLAESLLLYRTNEQKRGEQVAEVLGNIGVPAGSGDKAWTEIVQYALLRRFGEAAGERGRQELAEQFAMSMKDVLGELMVLLIFSSTYAVRMALLSRDAKAPAPRRVYVWYAGLGSLLFDLCPLGAGEVDRWRTAQAILADVISSVCGVEATQLYFDRRYGKESVCQGAVLAAVRAADQAANGQVSRPTRGSAELRTVWWSEATRVGGEAGPKWNWNDRYSIQEVRAIAEAERETITTAELFRCFEEGVRIVGETTFGSQWTASTPRLSQLRQAFADQYARACLSIFRGDPTAPQHPVRAVTNLMKTEVCELIELP